MDTLILSQTAIFRMQRLASCIYHKTGQRHRMATQDGMLELLREGAASRDAEICAQYDAFVRELNKRQIDMLEASNVKLHKPLGSGMNSAAISAIRKAG